MAEGGTERLADSLELLRQHLCGYVGQPTCDCKYGASGRGEQTGCPELRDAIDYLRTARPVTVPTAREGEADELNFRGMLHYIEQHALANGGCIPAPAYKEACDVLNAVQAVVEHARKISPSDRMGLYVTDVEVALGLRPADTPEVRKTGGNDGVTAASASSPALPETGE